MDPSPLATVVAVPPTPFAADGAVDLAAYERVLTRAIDGGITAFTIGGNTGEFAALGPQEVEDLIDRTTRVLDGRAVFLAGIGGDLATARRLASRAAGAGAFGIMIHEPGGPFRSPAGWRRYHVDIACSVPRLAVVPYVRDPAIGPDDLQALVAEAPNVVAVKYAVPDPIRFADLATAAPGLLWICGLAEGWAPFFWPAGAKAFTSGLAVVEPRLALDLLDQLREGRTAAALATWSLLRPFEALRARDQGRANVAAIKEALAQRAGIGRAVRPPISELGTDDRREVGRILAAWDQAVGARR